MNSKADLSLEVYAHFRVSILRNVREVSDLLYADKLCHCKCVAGIAGNMSAEHTDCDNCVLIHEYCENLYVAVAVKSCWDGLC